MSSATASTVIAVPTRPDILVHIDTSAAQNEIGEAWQSHKKNGLAFGQVCYDWSERISKSKGGYGSKGEGLSEILRVLDIPRYIVDYWIQKYKASVGRGIPCPSCGETFSSKTQLKKHQHKLHPEPRPAPPVSDGPYGHYHADLEIGPRRGGMALTRLRDTADELGVDCTISAVTETEVRRGDGATGHQYRLTVAGNKEIFASPKDLKQRLHELSAIRNADADATFDSQTKNADVVQVEQVTSRDEMAYQTDPSAPTYEVRPSWMSKDETLLNQRQSNPRFIEPTIAASGVEPEEITVVTEKNVEDRRCLSMAKDRLNQVQEKIKALVILKDDPILGHRVTKTLDTYRKALDDLSILLDACRRELA